MDTETSTEGMRETQLMMRISKANYRHSESIKRNNCYFRPSIGTRKMGYVFDGIRFNIFTKLA